MRRIFLRLWIFGLAFGLGISVSALTRLYRLHQVPDVSLVILTPFVPPVTDRPLEMVRSIDACGPKSNYHVYDLSDGSRISTTCETFASSAAAARALQARLGKALVTERSLNLDAKGRTVGEMILVTTPTVLRLVTYERSLCVTEAPSLRHLRLFER